MGIRKDSNRNTANIDHIEQLMTPTDEIITLEEVAKLTRYNYSYVRKVYMSWIDRGVKVLRAGPNARPRFYKSDILKMLEVRK